MLLENEEKCVMNMHMGVPDNGHFCAHAHALTTSYQIIYNMIKECMQIITCIVITCSRTLCTYIEYAYGMIIIIHYTLFNNKHVQFHISPTCNFLGFH